MIRIDLTKYRDHAVIGSAGDIVLTEPDVMPRHAELRPTTDGSPGIILCPLDGEVWVERGPVLTLVRGDFHLADGDVAVMGSHRMLYRNVAAALAERSVKEMIRWLS